jgi:NADPH-dependent curcumin reductase CurA
VKAAEFARQYAANADLWNAVHASHSNLMDVAIKHENRKLLLLLHYLGLAPTAKLSVRDATPYFSPIPLLVSLFYTTVARRYEIDPCYFTLGKTSTNVWRDLEGEGAAQAAGHDLYVFIFLYHAIYNVDDLRYNARVCVCV